MALPYNKTKGIIFHDGDSFLSQPISSDAPDGLFKISIDLVQFSCHSKPLHGEFLVASNISITKAFKIPNECGKVRIGRSMRERINKHDGDFPLVKTQKTP